jgi:branched-chain amino acid transport system permease protein
MIAVTLPAFRVQRGTRASRIALGAAITLVAVMASMPAWGSSGQMKVLVEFLTLLAMAQMWNLLAGYAGLVSIGQQAFIGLGAYGLFVAVDRLGLPVIPAILITTIVCGGIAWVTSRFAFRLHGGYFAIGTWVIAEVFRIVVSNTKELGAGTGVTIQTAVRMAPADRQALAYWLALAVGSGSIVLVAFIMRSRLGLALQAVRDSEVAARSLGVDLVRAKLVIYLIAAMGCAAAGAVVYLQLLRIQPNAAFGVVWTAKVNCVVVIGGLGRIEGPILGSIVFFALQAGLSDYGSLYLIILGAVAIAITILAPGGLWGLFTRYRPMALFGIQRRLVFDGAAPPVPPPASPAGLGRHD